MLTLFLPYTGQVNRNFSFVQNEIRPGPLIEKLG